jgi:hypothetical protein
MKKTEIKQGQRFGRLTVIREVEPHVNPKGKKIRMVLCKCDCGNEKTLQLSKLSGGITTSCGCLRLEKVGSLNKRYEKITGKKLPNGFSFTKSRIYKIWANMLHRCINPNEKNYYGNGISVCEEWRSDFFNFYFWAIENGYTDKLTIDRIDSNGNYEPSNCRWATYKQQNNNNCMNRSITYNGETHTIGEWGDITGIGRDLLYQRIIFGHWDIEKAFTMPPEQHRKPLTDIEVRDIRKKRNDGFSAKDLANEYNIDISCIYHLLKGVTYKNIK